jgi:hypothetical protein
MTLWHEDVLTSGVKKRTGASEEVAGAGVMKESARARHAKRLHPARPFVLTQQRASCAAFSKA